MGPGRRGSGRQVAAGALLAGLFLAALGVTGTARLERADFVLNNGAEVSSLDPAAVTGIPEGRVMYALYEGLTVRAPDDLRPLPGMAASWEVSSDGLTYTFHIRADARWSNGDRLTARDFEWSWKRLLTPEVAAEYAYQLWYVRGARDFTLLPIDVELGAEARVWVRATQDGNVRIGTTAFCLGRAPDQVPRPALRVGATAAAGDVLATLGDEELRLPLGGRVVAVQAPGVDPRDDPYGEGWLVELAPAIGELGAARTDGRLLPVEQARDELVWPRYVGIRAVDERTLVVELDSPTPFFIHLLSFYPTFPVHRKTLEWARAEFPETWQIEWLRPGNIVTNGPYVVVERRINDRIRLAKNPRYWDRENVAMRTIDILAVESYGTMLNLYLNGEVDWIDRCAPNLIPRLLRREDFVPQPYLGTYFYRVNVNRPPMDDVRVRRALALTIDRRALCERIMKKGEEPNWSLCPGGLPGYPRPELAHAPVAPDLSNYDEAFAADCAEAVALLVQAGYGPGGAPFPTIEIHYNTSEAHRDIAEVVADGWKRRLGIDAKLLNQEWKVYLDTQNTVNYDVSRSAWIGDYPDPNTFVDLFVTGGENNRTGWGNARYDELVSAAARAGDPAERLALLAEAEALLLAELPILPIYTYVTQNLVNPRLGGFHENVQDVHMPKFLYWMDDQELAAKRALLPEGVRLAPAPGPAEGLYAPGTDR